MAMDRVERRLHQVSAALDAARIPYAVCGGHAVAAWVSRVDPAATRATKDVNLLVCADDDSPGSVLPLADPNPFIRHLPLCDRWVSLRRRDSACICLWRRCPGLPHRRRLREAAMVPAQDRRVSA